MMMKKYRYRTSKRPSRIMKLLERHPTWVNRETGEYVAVHELIPSKRFACWVRFGKLGEEKPVGILPPRYFWDKHRPMTAEESEALWDKLFKLPESDIYFKTILEKMKKDDADDHSR